MAAAARISTLTDELISAITGVSDKNTPRFRKWKRFVEKSLRNDSTLRTNKFEVASRLDGLQKKFQIVGQDQLADALRRGLNELDTKQRRWAPDVLWLFLELSDKPTTLSGANSARKFIQSSVAQPAALEWTDLGPPDTFGSEDDIWKDINYSSETSEDDISITSSDVSIPRIIPQTSKVPLDEYILPDDLFLPVEDEELIYSIQDAQRTQERRLSRHDTGTVSLTELQAIREVIYMLQDLPTMLFRELNGNIEADHAFTLHSLSPETFLSLLKSFGSVGSYIRRVRKFIEKPQQVPLMQTFRRELEIHISAFDKYLSGIHGHYLEQSETVYVSIMKLHDDVRRETNFLKELAELNERLAPHGDNEGFRCLDELYELVCLKQASGDEHGFRLSVETFFKCFEVYSKPIQLWVQQGQLSSSPGMFFIKEKQKEKDPRTLWHEWYSLEEVSGTLFAPKFLHPAATKIFTAGKSTIFLRRLGVVPEDSVFMKPAALTYDDVCPWDGNGSLLPFSGLLEIAFDRFIHESHKTASSLLRTQLDEQCGLWVSLQALQYIYLGKDLSRSALIDSKIFELIDKGNQTWNDRFLLTDLVQQAFCDLSCVDSSRLVARTRRISYPDFKRGSRSVKILNAVSIEYVLPWPVANIITKEALNGYQGVSTFLMQIRRTKYLLERPYLLRSYSPFRAGNDTGHKLAFWLRYRLVQFINALYSHVTEICISSSSATMVNDLARAADVDAMIAIHHAYMSSLEDQCLLSERHGAIFDAVISILNLGIQFSDVQMSRHAKLQFELSNQTLDSALAQQRHQGTDDRGESLDDDDDGDDDVEEKRMASQNNATNIPPLDFAYNDRVLEMKTEFSRQCSFVAASLREVGRSDGQQGWEVLADKLQSRQEAQSSFS